jgi:two-component system NtrC family sensor kinase
MSPRPSAAKSPSPPADERSVGRRRFWGLGAQTSIPARIFAGFAVVFVSFASVAGVSLWEHQRTATTLRILHEGYLPLSLSISEARATQGAFATMVERTLEGADTVAAEGWLEVARRFRPFALRRALEAANQAQRLVKAERDKATLTTLRTELEAVLFEYELAEDDFDALSSSLTGRDRAARVASLSSIRIREREAQLHLTRAWTLIGERIAVTSRQAREDERRAIALLMGLGLLALAMSVTVTVWTQRVLSPLTTLSSRVLAVARGDLSPHSEPHADDEIGRVASEFERMVSALAERDAQLRQSERLAAVGRLAAHVTHEVRNPLNSIRLNVELLQEDVADFEPEAGRMLASIVREVDRLTDITDQYLRLVRLPEPKPKPTNLAELVRDVTAFLAPEMERANVAVELSLEPALTVPIDEGQIRQALLNLWRNAREAMPEGGALQITLVLEKGHARLCLADSGSGIPETEREKIFDLFYTTKQHGTGLGLPLTLQIIAAHGGRIECLARAGGGTVFEVWLPRAELGTTQVAHAADKTS